MGAVGLVQLGSLRLQAQQRADMVNSQFVTPAEWNQYISLAYKELYDILITEYGSTYYMAMPYVFSTAIAGSVAGQGVLYPLPNGVDTVDLFSGQVAPALYKLLGVDMQTGAANTVPTLWVTLDRFMMNERNRYGFTGMGVGSTQGLYAVRYAIMGDNIWLTPVPSANLTMQLWYVPQPSNLLVNITGLTAALSPVVAVPDTSQLNVGMTVQLLGQTATYPITAITPNVDFTLGGFAPAVGGVCLFQAWDDAMPVQGISGWEEFVIVSAAIKAIIKEESDPSALMAQKGELKQRIIEVAADRDIGKPNHVSPPTDRSMNWGTRWGQWGW